MSIRRLRNMRGLRSGKVIQILRTVPLVPEASARVKLWPAFTCTVGDPFLPLLACAAFPFSPFGFSPLAHLVSTPSGISNSDWHNEAWDIASIMVAVSKAISLFRQNIIGLCGRYQLTYLI
jgi:hypothetical protein